MTESNDFMQNVTLWRRRCKFSFRIHLYLFPIPSFRSVVRITNSLGDVINRYTYDPFGNIADKVEIVENMFLYNGQWGVRALFGF